MKIGDLVKPRHGLRSLWVGLIIKEGLHKGSKQFLIQWVGRPSLREQCWEHGLNLEIVNESR